MPKDLTNSNRTLSMRSTLSIAIIVMGIIGICLALMSAGMYRDLTFENQRTSLATLVDLKAEEILLHLEETSGKLSSEMSAEENFKNAYKTSDTAALQHVLDDQFSQYYVTANVIDVAKLVVYDAKYQQLTQSTRGLQSTNPGKEICPSHLRKVAQRRGVERLKLNSSLCVFQDETLFSVFAPFGGLRTKGYIQVITRPVHSLRNLEKELAMPVKILSPDDKTLYTSATWPENNLEDRFLLATDVVKNENGHTALQLVVANSMESLHEKLSQTRSMIIIAASFITWIAIWLMMWILNKTTINPLSLLTRQVRKVRRDKAHLGEEVNVRGNTEVCELAKDFNEMTGELKELYSTLEDMAYTDSLTDLPNRTLFQDRISQLVALSRRETRRFAVLMMDLDRFKEVNDTLGHEYGDKLLKSVSKRLSDALRQSDTISFFKDDTVARLGGDEFAALLPTTQNEEGAAAVAKKICSLLEKPFEIDGHEFSVGISIGISMYPKDGEDVPTLIRHADIAMYEAKRNHRGYTFYSEEHDQHTVENLKLGNELRETLHNDQLDLFFQPKIDFSSGRVCGAEALLRWFHPEKGFIPPDQFVALAEKIGLIQPLTIWVLNKALEQVSRWQYDNIPLDVAINLSALSLHDGGVITDVSDALKEWKVKPTLLSLELTESAVMRDPQRAMLILKDLGAMGVKLSVDDFGTGYSSLSHLKQLPVDEIKIDRSFVMEMMENKNDEAIVRSTIDLAHNMGLKVIAEGIETDGAYQHLKSLRCDMGQGYYMGRPVNNVDLSAWLKSSPFGLKANK